MYLFLISKYLNKIFIFYVFLLFSCITIACDTTARLILSSSGYNGEIAIQLREGLRPGSTIVGIDTIITSGQKEFYGICPGRYFFAFASKESASISVTSYFTIASDTDVAQMTVFLSKNNSSSANDVKSIRKKDL